MELAKIRELLPHTDVRTTMRYLKIRDAAKHDAIALLKGPSALSVAPCADSPWVTARPIA